MLTAPPSIEIAERIRLRARELGFDSVGFAPIHPSEHAAVYMDWLEAGHAGEMGYLSRPDAVEKRADPGLVVPGARSAVVVLRSYAGDAPGNEGIPADRGVVAR